MKKLMIAAASVLMFAACTKNIARFNEETKKPATVPAGTLFANAQKTIADGLASASVNTNVFRFTVKHWAMTTYQDEAQFDFFTRAIPQAWWARMYRDVLLDLKESARLVTTDATIAAKEKDNKLAMIDIMQVYAYNILINSFGDVPYTEALDYNNLFPKYDDAKTVYNDLLKRITADIGKLTTSSAGFSSTEDLVYQGKTVNWVKFATSMKLKMGMIIADVDDAGAKAAVEAADATAFSAATDNAVFNYLGPSPAVANPLYIDIIVGKRGDYVAAKDLMDVLIAKSDPRKTNFFAANNAGNYVGGIVGAGNNLPDNSQPSLKVSDAKAPCLLLDYVETEFFRAEAKERGYTVAGTAESHYNNAIRASIIAWGGTNTDADTYLARPDVAYTTATGTWKQKIGSQKWIALYNRPFEGWTEIRRLDFPVLTAPVNAKSGYPNRFTYPGNEQQLNGANYTAASSKIGGDKVETKLFWDKF